MIHFRGVDPCEANARSANVDGVAVDDPGGAPNLENLDDRDLDTLTDDDPGPRRGYGRGASGWNLFFSW